jgi:hypothetical protein
VTGWAGSAGRAAAVSVSSSSSRFWSGRSTCCSLSAGGRTPRPAASKSQRAGCWRSSRMFEGVPPCGVHPRHVKRRQSGCDSRWLRALPATGAFHRVDVQLAPSLRPYGASGGTPRRAAIRRTRRSRRQVATRGELAIPSAHRCDFVSCSVMGFDAVTAVAPAVRLASCCTSITSYHSLLAEAPRSTTSSRRARNATLVSPRWLYHSQHEACAGSRTTALEPSSLADQMPSWVVAKDALTAEEGSWQELLEPPVPDGLA